MSDPQALVQERLSHYTGGILGSAGHLLGVDLGGYGLRAVLIDLQHQTYSSRHAEVQGTNPEQIVAATLNLVRELLAEQGVTPDRLVRIGVGFGGLVDPQAGRIRLAPRVPGWEDFPLQQAFEQAFDAVTLIDNNANLIALGEAMFGVGKECSHLCYLHLSSGVGGGVVLNGQLYHGATATAGEVGHVIVTGRIQGEERPQTLEELVSVSGILRRAAAAGLKTEKLEDVFGDHPAGRQVIDETVDVLARHLAQVVVLLDPQIIVLGGVVVRIGGSAFVQRIVERMRDYIAPRLVRPVEVVASELGVDSIAIGAVALALESLRD